MEGPQTVWFEIFLVLLLILANGIFALSEIAILSSRKVRLTKLSEEGNNSATVALELYNEPTQFLSAIQVGITLIGIVTGAYGGATIAKYLAVCLSSYNILPIYAETFSMTLVVVVITYLSLIVGELVPKKIALNNPETIACFIAIPMKYFAKIVSPIVEILSVSTKLILHILKISPSTEAPVTEEEIKVLIAEGAEYGTFEHEEKDLVNRVFNFTDLKVSALMTPRTKIEWLDNQKSNDYNMDVLINSSHSWLPLAKGNLDELVGIVKAKDVLSSYLKLEYFELESALQKPLIVPKSMTAFKLLDLFKKSGIHIALVIDEFGGFTGLVTVHDILEQLVGDMPQEDDEQQIITREDGSWLVDGLIPIEIFKEYFDIKELPLEDVGEYHTLGGFITAYLGNIPKVTDCINLDDLKIEIIDMDKARVDKVLILKIK